MTVVDPTWLTSVMLDIGRARHIAERSGPPVHVVRINAATLRRLRINHQACYTTSTLEDHFELRFLTDETLPDDAVTVSD